MGILEILLVLAFALVIFGYKRLPALGRSAGEKVNQLSSTARGTLGDKETDPGSLGRRAGQGVREARELREALGGKGPRRGEEGVSDKGQPAERDSPRSDRDR